MELNKLILKFTWKNKHARIARKGLEKKNCKRQQALPDVKIDSEASIIQTE